MGCFVVASITQEGKSTLTKSWFGKCIEQDLKLSDFYAEFSAGKFDNEPLPDDRQRGLLKSFRW